MEKLVAKAKKHGWPPRLKCAFPETPQHEKSRGYFIARETCRGREKAVEKEPTLVVWRTATLGKTLLPKGNCRCHQGKEMTV